MIDGAKFKEANDAMELAMAEIVRFTMMTAQLSRAKYLALIKVGFDEKQAIELCKEPLR